MGFWIRVMTVMHSIFLKGITVCTVGKTMVCIRFGFGNLLGYLKTMEWWSHQLG